MKTIYKYQFETADIVTLKLPTCAKVLTIQIQNDKPCLWALVDTENERTFDMELSIFGTGHEVKNLELSTYIGTYQERNGGLVWHVFEHYGSKLWWDADETKPRP